MPAIADPKLIQGHPELIGENSEGRAVKITVCGNCEAVRSILLLAGDRFLCTKCRTEGQASGKKTIPLSPRSKRHG